jgi:type IV fimbrial biogenesis protein FimT
MMAKKNAAGYISLGKGAMAMLFLKALDKQRRNRRARRGFTLIELMLAVLILGILMTIGVPSFTRLIVQNRLTSQANEFISGLNRAKSESIKRAAAVRVISASGDEIFSSSGYRVATSAATGTSLYDVAGTTGGIKISRISAASGTDETSAANRSFAEFNTRGGITATGSLMYKVCSVNNTSLEGRLITVNTVGRIAVTRNTFTTC